MAGTEDRNLKAGTKGRNLKARIETEAIKGHLFLVCHGLLTLFFSTTQDQVPEGIITHSWLGHSTSDFSQENIL